MHSPNRLRLGALNTTYVGPPHVLYASGGVVVRRGAAGARGHERMRAPGGHRRRQGTRGSSSSQALRHPICACGAPPSPKTPRHGRAGRRYRRAVDRKMHTGGVKFASFITRLKTQKTRTSSERIRSSSSSPWKTSQPQSLVERMLLSHPDLMSRHYAPSKLCLQMRRNMMWCSEEASKLR